ncbi:MAG TPA: ABC transporter permease [Cryomorphaceae bacterium]|nr:ABC transporter permease [Cryomorphaceae bacterium]
MIDERLKANFRIALEALISNQTRSLLTALGIIFGVAAVISMLAIGNGTQAEINEQMKLVGVNNIVIEPIVEQKEENLDENVGGKEKEKFSPGLRLIDAASIQEIIPSVKKISPEIVLETYIISNGIRRSAKLVGVEPVYFDIFNFAVAEGEMFNKYQVEIGAPVCIIGKSIKNRFFPTENAIGKKLKVGPRWLEVIGVLEQRLISESSVSSLGIRDYNMDVYTPLETVLIRYENRDMVTKAMIEQANASGNGMGDEEENSQTSTSKNYHQIDRMVVQVEKTELLSPIADVISRLLERKHFNVVDYQIEIPELLLKQQKRNNELFNYVLGAIAGISLLVGGIGIMNIMLASVLERIKEIGLRLALGAKKQDIIHQFMFESVLISISGGLIGVVLGVTMAFLVSQLADINTVISFSSILISFGVAASVGLVFGIAPARRAAMQSPINSLRYE